MSADRITPPHDMQAEESVLGAVLLERTALAAASAFIGADDFYREAHKKIFRAMVALADRSDLIDLITLSAELRAANELADVGGPAYLAEISERVPSSAGVEQYAKIVKRASILRTTAQLGATIATSALHADFEALTESIGMLVTTELGVKAVPTMAEAVASVMAEIEKTRRGERRPGVPTGLFDLDNFTGGIPYEWLILIGGRPGLGKSALLHTWMFYAAEMGIRCGLIDLEMGRKGVLTSLISKKAKVSRQAIRYGRVNEVQMGDLSQAAEAAAGWPIEIVEHERRWSAIKMAYRRMADNGAQFVALDYLNKVEPDQRTKNQFDDMKRIAYDAHSLSHKVGVPLILVCQLNREVEKEKDKRPKMHHFGETGGLEQAADLILCPFYEHRYNTKADPKKAEIHILKQKDGAFGAVDVAWDGPTSMFSDWVPQEDMGF